MLDTSLKIEKKEAIVYDPIPADVYQVELLDITKKEVPQYNDKTKMEFVMDFQFTLLEGKAVNLEDLRGRSLWRNFVPTFLYISKKNGKNALYQISEAIIGRELTTEEEAYMDGNFLNGLVGKQCRVVVENKTTDKGTFSNIKSFLPVKGLLPALTNEEREKAIVKTKTEDETPEVNPNLVDPDEAPLPEYNEQD